MPKSIEAMVQASVNILSKDGLRAGVRAFPVFKESRLRVKSLASRDRSISKCWMMRVKSLSSDSSSFCR